MSRPSHGTLVLGLAALFIALSQPFVEVIWRCRKGYESSEACVWDKSLLPLSVGIGMVVIAPVVFGVLCLIRAAWQSLSARSLPPG